MNSKVIVAIAAIVVLIGIGIAVGFDYEENESPSIPSEESEPRLITRGLTEGFGVTSP